MLYHRCCYWGRPNCTRRIEPPLIWWGAVRLLIFFTAISFMPLNISQKCRAAGFIDAALKMHCFFPWRMIIY